MTRFDEEPNDPHYECGLEIHTLNNKIKDQAIEIESLRRFLYNLADQFEANSLGVRAPTPEAFHSLSAMIYDLLEDERE